jgi:transposase
MGSDKRKYHSAAFKAKVALEALKERETINQIASRYEIHPNLITQWKKQLMDSSSDCFGKKQNQVSKEDVLKDELYQQIGKLKVEVDWLKKKSESLNPRKTHVS